MHDETPLTPPEFEHALEVLLKASAAISVLPLAEMSYYIDAAEKFGEGLPSFTAERQATAKHVGRLIAAATHLRTAAAMGGR